MAQTMQAFIANMLEMRKQEADAARFRAAMQQREQEEWGNFVSQMGAGISNAITKGAPSARDTLANQMMQQQYTIPGARRAQAVNPAVQGPADAIAKNMYTGGMQEFEMRQKMEDQTAQRAVEGSQIDARIAKLNLAQAGSERADEVLLLRQQAAARQAELDEQKAELALVKKAREDFALTTKQYQGLVANAKGYTSQMAVALKALGHAKTPEEHQAAADAIQAHYQAGIGTGLKVAEPVIRPFVDELQRDEILRQEQRLKADITGVTTDAWPDFMQGGLVPYGKVSREQQAMKGLEALRSQPGYAEAQPGYTAPEQSAGIFPVIPPAPEIPAILGGTGPNPTPAQAVGGTASGTAAPIPISADDAFKMTGVRRAPGKRFDSGPGTQVYVVK